MFRQKLHKIVARSLIGLLCMQSIMPTTAYASTVKEQTVGVINEEEQVFVSLEANEKKEYRFTPDSDDIYIIDFLDAPNEALRVKVMDSNGQSLKADNYYSEEFNGLDYVAYELTGAKQYTIQIYEVEETTISETFTIKKSQVESLELLTPPSTLTYRKGTFGDISYYGLQVQIKFKDGREPELIELENERNGLSINIDEQAGDTPWYEVAGEHTVAVRYQGSKVTFTIEVVEGNDFSQTISLGEAVDYRVTNMDYAFYTFTSQESGVYMITQHIEEQVNVTLLKLGDGYQEEMYDINYSGTHIDENDSYVQYYQLDEDASYVVKVNGLDATDAYGSFTVDRTNVKQISVNTMPNQTEYYKGSNASLNLNGLSLDVEYQNGTTETILYGDVPGIGYKDICESNQEDGHSEWDFTDYEGSHQMGIQYRGIITHISVTVVEDPIADVAIKSTPSKNVYYQGFDKNIVLDGLQLDVTLADGSFDVISSEDSMIEYLGVYLSEDDMANGDKTSDWYDYEGEYLVGIRYKNRTLGFTITVQNPVITEIKMTSVPNKMTYLQYAEDILDFSGIQFELYHNDEILAVVSEEAINGWSMSPSDWYEKVGTYSVNLTIVDQSFQLDGITVISIEDKLQEATEVLQVNEEIQFVLDEQQDAKIYKVTPTKTADYMFRLDLESVVFPYPSPYLLDQNRNVLGSKIGNDQDEICYVNLEAGKTYYYVVRFPQMEGETATISLKEGNIQSFSYVSKSLPEELMQTRYGELNLYNGKFRITNTNGSTLELEYNSEFMNWQFATKVNSNWSNTPGQYKVNITCMNKTAVYPFEVQSMESYTGAMDTLSLGETYYVEYDENATDSYVTFIPETTGIYEIKTTGYANFAGYIIDSQGFDVVQMIADWTDEECSSVIAELKKGSVYYIKKHNSDYSFALNLFDQSTIQSIQLTDRDISYDYLQYRDTVISKYAFCVDVVIEGHESSEYQIRSTFEPTVSNKNWYNVPGNHTVTWDVLGQKVECPIRVVDTKEYFDSAIEVLEGIPLQSDADEYRWEGYFYKFTPKTTAYYASKVEIGRCQINGWFFDEFGQLVAKNDPYAVAKLESGKTYYVNLKRVETDADYSLTISKLNESELENANYNLDASVQLSNIDTQSYTGAAIKPELEITKNGIRLVENEDYRVSFYDNVSAGKAKVIVQISSEENESVTVVKSFNIIKENYGLGEAKLKQTTYPYSGLRIAPKPVVTNSKNAVLLENVDYTLSYSTDCKNAGQKTVKIIGKGQYTGTLTLTYTITKAPISSAIVSNIAAQTYTGKAITPAATVKVGSTLLKAGTDYVSVYTNNVAKGTATISLTGKGNYTGTVKRTFTINSKSLSNLTIKKIATKVYSGQNIKPGVTITNGSATLRLNKDYKVTYKNNKGIGTATIVVTGMGNYTGTKNVTFAIIPKKTASFKAISKKTKEILVSWKKDSSVTGYQIVYATNSKQTANRKTVNVKKNSTTSTTLKKLTKNKNYYISIRSYKTVNGKPVYSSVSKVLKVKAK